VEKKQDKETPIITREQFTTGASYLKMFLKKIDVEVAGPTVIVKQTYDFMDERLSKSFAESLKKTFEEGI